MDLVYRAPATTQIAWALGDEETRRVLELCQDIARDKSLAWLEESVAQIRWGSGGCHRGRHCWRPSPRGGGGGGGTR